MNNVKKLDALTSLRFFAAAMIVVGHAHPLFGSFGIATHYSLSQGVSFFFTLSGFILAYNYKALPDLSSAKRFLINRFARIWPLHIVTMLIWIALITPSMTHEFANTNEGIHKLILNIFLIQSWSFTAPNVLSFNGVAWSISTEAFFYVTLCFILMNKRINFPFAIVIFSLVAYSFIFVSTKAGITNDDGAQGITMFGTLYANPLVRIVEFLFGVLCFNIYQTFSKKLDEIPSIIWFAIEILIFALIIRLLQEVAAPTKIYNSWGAGAAYYVYKEGIWLFWGAMIIIFAKSTGLIAKFLSFRPIVFLGEASFALYLCHAIVINMSYMYPNFFNSFGAFDALAFWTVCILAASALHIFVENPCRRIIVGKFGGKNKPVPMFKGDA